GAAAPRLRRALRPGAPPRHLRRVPRLHRGRRVPPRAAVALGGLGGGGARGLGGAVLLGGPRRRVVALHARRDAARGPERARHPPLLLRGRRLRPLGGPPGRRLGRRPPRERGRVGGG